MRRLIIVLPLLLVSLLAWGVVTPAAHADPNYQIVVTPNTVVTGNTATVSGSGFSPSNSVYVYWQRPDGTANAEWVTSTPSGTWMMTLGFDASHGTGTEYVTAFDWGYQMWAPWTAVTVNGNGNPGPTSGPQVSANPSSVSLPSPTESFTASTTVTGTGFTPNNYAYIQWQRPDGTTGNTWAQTDGAGSFSFTLDFDPAHQCGNEVLQGYDYATGVWTPQFTETVHCGA